MLAARAREPAHETDKKCSPENAALTQSPRSCPLHTVLGCFCAATLFHAVLENGRQTNLTYKALSLPDLAGKVRLSNGFACGLLLAALQKGSEGAYLQAMNLQN